jgi:hypothetical protein
VPPGAAGRGADIEIEIQSRRFRFRQLGCGRQTGSAGAAGRMIVVA